MRYSLLVNAGPDAPAAQTALSMIRALLARGHDIQCLFFYRDGVLLASTFMAPAPEGIAGQWQMLVREQALRALVCVGAAARRGVFDEREAGRHGLQSGNLSPGFELAGLGQWIEAMATSDRVLEFGS